MTRTNRSERCTPIKFLGTTFANSNNLLELYLHAYKMNPDFNLNPNPNPNNLNNIGYNNLIGIQRLDRVQERIS